MSDVPRCCVFLHLFRLFVFLNLDNLAASLCLIQLLGLTIMSSIDSSPRRGQERPCVYVLITLAAYGCIRSFALGAHR